MGHIFISYSRHDLETVDCLVGKIENTGMRVWIDRDDIKAGRTWRAQIVQAIDTCDAFVLMLSSHSAVSDNVRKEIDLAQDSGRTVFIMRLDSVIKLPAEMRYQLVGLQYIDLQKLGMDDAVSQLIDTLREHIASPRPEGEPVVRQAELVIQGVDPSAFGAEKQQQILDFISEITKTPESQLQIAKLTAGSVHVFVDMPTPAAFELKSRALNRDRHFRQLRIKSLRLVGDRKYVNVSLGILTTTATIGFLKLLWLNIPSLFPSIVGITGGKIMILTSAIVVTTAVSLTVSHAMRPTLNPTLTSTPTPTPTRNPAETPTPTPTPQNPLVIQDTLCWTGPGPAYAVVSAVKAGTLVELLGRGSIPEWWIVSNPIYHSPCWMQQNDLRIDPNDFSNLTIFTPLPPPPPPTGKPHPLPTTTCAHPVWWNGRWICLPIIRISTPTIPIPN
ncbi:MAG TPA: toll/interleukin-1 receptor domain-containing protein [Anaerolineales bacterium]|nr:toll/interleukin-1 receptor domain-containing protein [Anaerolineales bacterium]